jgi:hypothetical protein
LNITRTINTTKYSEKLSCQPNLAQKIFWDRLCSGNRCDNRQPCCAYIFKTNAFYFKSHSICPARDKKRFDHPCILYTFFYFHLHLLFTLCFGCLTGHGIYYWNCLKYQLAIRNEKKKPKRKLKKKNFGKKKRNFSYNRIKNISFLLLLLLFG